MNTITPYLKCQQMSPNDISNSVASRDFPTLHLICIDQVRKGSTRAYCLYM